MPADQQGVESKQRVSGSDRENNSVRKITDMGTVQGLIMRCFDLIKRTVETAGQSGDGALVSLTGIVNAKDCCEAVLNQREKITAPVSHEKNGAESNSSSDTTALLKDIHDSLHRIEKNPGNSNLDT